MKHIKTFNNFILENKVYGKNIIDNIIKKIGNSEDVLNYLIIYGLFRQQEPFKRDIFTIL